MELVINILAIIGAWFLVSCLLLALAVWIVRKPITLPDDSEHA